jgi:hypothetical protein
LNEQLLGGATDEVHLLVPPFSTHLRSIRLMAADAALRAGLDVAETDDLRIAVDELAHALMMHTDHRVHVAITVERRCVIVRGSARHRGTLHDDDLQLPTITETIVDAVADRHLLHIEDDKIVFVVVKQNRREQAAHT